MLRIYYFFDKIKIHNTASNNFETEKMFKFFFYIEKNDIIPIRIQETFSKNRFVTGHDIYLD